LQEELKEMVTLADESYRDFDANLNDNSTGAIIKLRGELVRIYRMMRKLETDTEGKTDITKAIDELEEISKNAHKRAGLTYAPLNLL
jgi:hypothetical protein